MILNRQGAEFEYEGITYTIGGAVVGTAGSEYAGLYGRINAIYDGEDKETENETPDIYCEFDPPVMPDEIKALEETFSVLYDQPKTLDDIALDMVIMAPEMIRPLDDLHTVRKKVPIYIVMEDWAVDGEHGNYCELFTDYDDARRIMLDKLREEFNSGAIPQWSDTGAYVADTTKESYKGYIEGDYMDNHYEISLLPQPLLLSTRHIREIGELYKAQCRTADFISQIEKWEEIAALSKMQYQKLITNPAIPDRIEQQLGHNDHYWEAYWESVTEVAHALVRQASKQLDCFTSEDSYPLCAGSGKPECAYCCRYVHLKGEGGYEC